MQQIEHYFSKLVLPVFIFAINLNGLAQSGRGAIACPDFNIASTRQHKLKFNTMNFLKTKIFSHEGTIKVSPLYRTGIGFASTDKSSTNGGQTTTNDSSGWVTPDFNMVYLGFLVSYEQAFKKKASLQFAIGPEFAVSAETYKNGQPSTDDKAQETQEIATGLNAYNLIFMGAYRHYFLYALRRFYVSPILRLKIGRVSYIDWNVNRNDYDIDYKERSITIGTGVLAGYQALLYKRIAVDIFLGPEIKYTNVYSRKFSNTTGEEFEKKHDLSKTKNIYEKTGLGLKWGISLGYKFGKKK